MIKAGSKKSGGTAATIIKLIGSLYKIEKLAREEDLSSDQIRMLRQEYSRPIMDEIKTLLPYNFLSKNDSE